MTWIFCTAAADVQVVQVGQEQRRIPPLLRLALGEKDLAAAPVDRAGKVTLLVRPRGLNLGLLTLKHNTVQRKMGKMVLTSSGFSS